MKNYVFVVLAVLLLTFSAVFAQETETVQEINWEDIAPSLEESGLEGEFFAVGDFGVAMWVPAQLHEVELTEEDVEKGYISYLTTDDESVAVAIVCADGEGMTLEDYMTYLANSEDISGVEYGLVNGIEAVSYDYEGNMNVAFMTDAGYLVEFTFGPMSDEGFATVASIMAASIQTIEE